MDIVCLADTHELHDNVTVPGGDILVFAGDLTFFSRRPCVVRDFNAWLGDLPFRHRIVVPGNHDRLLEEPVYQRQITNAHLLINSGIEIEGLKIWGSPVTPYADTAFGMPVDQDLAAHWARIPSNLDLLITHIPPFGILDRVPGGEFHQGCRELAHAVALKHPTSHVFGHVHGGYGSQSTPHTLFINAALASEDGDLDKAPIRIRYERMPAN